MFLSNNSNYPIGLDISDSSLKLVQLDKSREKIKIQALGKADLKEGLFEKGEIKNPEGIIAAIKKLIEKPQFGKVTSDEVVSCLPETKSFLKLLDVEKSPNDISNILQSEIEKQIPVTTDEIYYDWQIVKHLRDRQLILVGASPKNIVDQYTSLLEKSGLSVVALEVEPIPICRGLLAEENSKLKSNFDKNYAIIDIGAARTSLTVYSKNTILFSISIPISGNEITAKIADLLQIDIRQAEKAKIICGLDENKAQGVVKNMLASVTGELINKISETILFYNHHYPDRGPISQILLCGGGANIKNLCGIIANATNINTTIGDPTLNLAGEKENLFKILGKLSEDGGKKSKQKTDSSLMAQNTSSTFDTAIGLALRNIFLDD